MTIKIMQDTKKTGKGSGGLASVRAQSGACNNLLFEIEPEADGCK